MIYDYNGNWITEDVFDCVTFEMFAEKEGIKILSKQELEESVSIFFGGVVKYEYISNKLDKKCYLYEVALYADNESYGVGIYTCENDFNIYAFYKEVIEPRTKQDN